jgi:hypothetical protein
MRNLISDPKPPTCLHILGQGLVDATHAQGHRAFNAVAVICKTPAIRAWLEINDKKALEQCDAVMAIDQKGAR